MFRNKKNNYYDYLRGKYLRPRCPTAFPRRGDRVAPLIIFISLSAPKTLSFSFPMAATCRCRGCARQRVPRTTAIPSPVAGTTACAPAGSARLASQSRHDRHGGVAANSNAAFNFECRRKACCCRRASQIQQNVFSRSRRTTGLNKN